MLQEKTQNSIQPHHTSAVAQQLEGAFQLSSVGPDKLVLATSEGKQYSITTSAAPLLANLWQEARGTTVGVSVGTRYNCRQLIEKTAGVESPVIGSLEVVAGPFEPLGVPLTDSRSVAALVPMSVFQICGMYVPRDHETAQRGVVHYGLVLATEEERIVVLEKRGVGPLVISTLGDSLAHYRDHLIGDEVQVYVCSLAEFRGDDREAFALEW